MDVDPRDRTLIEHVPLIAMPRYTNFVPLDRPGHRYVAAEDGVWLELRRPWLHLTHLVCEATIPLPYGPMIEDGFELSFESEDLAPLLSRFIVDARAALPNECAAWGVWDERKELLVYRPCIAIAAGPGSVTFHRPALEAHEHLAVDIHSHGSLGAFFSRADDEDDHGEVKLSVVIGNLDTDEPSVQMRLCCMGISLMFDEPPA